MQGHGKSRSGEGASPRPPAACPARLRPSGGSIPAELPHAGAAPAATLVLILPALQNGSKPGWIPVWRSGHIQGICSPSAHGCTTGIHPGPTSSPGAVMVPAGGTGAGARPWGGWHPGCAWRLPPCRGRALSPIRSPRAGMRARKAAWPCRRPACRDLRQGRAAEPPPTAPTASHAAREQIPPLATAAGGAEVWTPPLRRDASRAGARGGWSRRSRVRSALSAWMQKAPRLWAARPSSCPPQPPAARPTAPVPQIWGARPWTPSAAAAVCRETLSSGKEHLIN